MIYTPTCTYVCNALFLRQYEVVYYTACIHAHNDSLNAISSVPRPNRRREMWWMILVSSVLVRLTPVQRPNQHDLTLWTWTKMVCEHDIHVHVYFTYMYEHMYLHICTKLVSCSINTVSLSLQLECVFVSLSILVCRRMFISGGRAGGGGLP